MAEQAESVDEQQALKFAKLYIELQKQKDEIAEKVKKLKEELNYSKIVKDMDTLKDSLYLYMSENTLTSIKIPGEKNSVTISKVKPKDVLKWERDVKRSNELAKSLALEFKDADIKREDIEKLAEKLIQK